MEHVAGLDVEDPVGGVLVRDALVEHVRHHVEAVVQLHHVLIHQIADELVGVVGGEDGVEAVVLVIVEGEDVVGLHGAGDVLALGGFRHEGGGVGAGGGAAGGKPQQHRRREQEADRFFQHVPLLTA